MNSSTTTLPGRRTAPSSEKVLGGLDTSSGRRPGAEVSMLWIRAHAAELVARGILLGLMSHKPMTPEEEAFVAKRIRIHQDRPPGRPSLPERTPERDRAREWIARHRAEQNCIAAHS
jgi:hypothetical protein